MQPSNEVQALKDRVNNIDLEPIAFKLVHPEEGKGWTVEKAYSVIELYRHFLVLNEIYPNISIVPTKEIDKVWHTHILDTAKYREDCETIFGRFIDHFPYFGLRGEEDSKNLQAAFEVSRSLFKEHFGSDPLSSFSKEAGCETGCSGRSLSSTRSDCDSSPTSDVADCGSGSCSPSCDAGQCGGCDNFHARYQVQTRPSLAASCTAPAPAQI